MRCQRDCASGASHIGSAAFVFSLKLSRMSNDETSVIGPTAQVPQWMSPPTLLPTIRMLFESSMMEKPKPYSQLRSMETFLLPPWPLR